MEEGENTFNKIFEEFQQVVAAAQQEAQKTGNPNPTVDIVPIVDKYIADLFAFTKRPLLIYATDFFNPQKAALAGNEISIILSDKDGIVEAIRKLPKGPLDIILHSPGGSLEATESIVDILRMKFNDIRIFIPNTAKSAATMMALSADEIYLASSAELGPIDPQMVYRKDSGLNQSPAQAIIDQFESAQKDLSKDANKLPAWIPILPMYGPSLYQDCKNAINLSKNIVRSWLVQYMFKSLPKKRDRVNRARKVVNYFSSHKKLKSHARRIGLSEIDQNLKGLLRIRNLDNEPELCNKVMGVYYCLLNVFQRSSSFKIIQDHLGHRYVRQIQVPQVPQIIPMPRP